jgi:hypothetical protein
MHRLQTGMALLCAYRHCQPPRTCKNASSWCLPFLLEFTTPHSSRTTVDVFVIILPHLDDFVVVARSLLSWIICSVGLLHTCGRVHICSLLPCLSSNLGAMYNYHGGTSTEPNHDFSYKLTTKFRGPLKSWWSNNGLPMHTELGDKHHIYTPSPV